MRIKSAAVTVMAGLALASQVASAHGPGYGYGHYLEWQYHDFRDTDLHRCCDFGSIDHGCINGCCFDRE